MVPREISAGESSLSDRLYILILYYVLLCIGKKVFEEVYM